MPSSRVAINEDPAEVLRCGSTSAICVVGCLDRCALCYVLERDGERDKPLIGTTDQFARFHAGSLQLSIDKKAVGKYAGLAESVDEVFVLAAGADVQTVTDEVREKIADACRSLAWKFAVHGNE